jgi:hypothetical protein
VFPVSIYFTTVSSERTIAAVVADEAFAKIKLYGVNFAALSYVNQTPFDLPLVLAGEYAYPSTPTTDPYSKRYWWSAICRRVDLPDPCSVQVTVFVSRKVGTGTMYYKRNPFSPFDFQPTEIRPCPVFVFVSAVGGRADELFINDPSNLINDGYTILDDVTGNIYRVLDRSAANPNIIRLDKNWQGLAPQRVWTVLPLAATSTSTLNPVTISRYPCIAVYQKVMRF